MYGQSTQGHHKNQNGRGTQRKAGRSMAPGAGQGRGRGMGQGQGECNGQGRGRGMGQGQGQCNGHGQGKGRGSRDGSGQCIRGEGGQKRGRGECCAEDKASVVSEQNVAANTQDSLPEEVKNA